MDFEWPKPVIRFDSCSTKLRLAHGSSHRSVSRTLRRGKFYGLKGKGWTLVTGGILTATMLQCAPAAGRTSDKESSKNRENRESAPDDFTTSMRSLWSHGASRATALPAFLRRRYRDRNTDQQGNEGYTADGQRIRFDDQGREVPGAVAAPVGMRS